ncbi:hypothetical protein BGZ76_003095 [Entomortierella beljakovae]|nr:hypothetical protein BGZ76_003095 [Entomortierella beljakovae]
MNFTLTSPEQLDLETYQQTLKNIILVLSTSSKLPISRHFGNNNNNNSNSSSNNNSDTTTIQIPLSSGGTFILDTSVTTPDFALHQIGSSGTKLTSSSQNYPFSFIATSQIPTLRQSSSSPSSSATTTVSQPNAPVQYFIRLPLNPITHGIQCQLSARRLCFKHVFLLDRILRRLCDSSPGAFMVGYSDGLSGVDAGTEVVYSGENSSYQVQPSKPQRHSHHNNQSVNQSRTLALDQSIAAARDRGNMDIDYHVAGLVGHVEYPGYGDGGSKQVLATKAVIKDMKNELGLTVIESVKGLGGQVQYIDGASFTIDDSDGIPNYDFGLLEDIEQFAEVHSYVEIDELHDMLWVN